MKGHMVTDRGGFTLVESLVAMVLAAVVVMSLAPALLQVAQQQQTFEATAQGNAVLLAQANRLSALPFEALPQQSECVTVAAGEFPHTRCVTVAASSVREKKLTITVQPLRPGLRADTLVVDRRRSRANPLVEAE